VGSRVSRRRPPGYEFGSRGIELTRERECKYFLKIAEVNSFFLYAEPLVPEVCTTLITAVTRPHELDLG
jgi:hypothetical protein